MPRLEVVVQSKKDYYKEQHDKLRIIWYMISSGLFTLLFWAFIPSLTTTLFWIFLGFVSLFVFADTTKNKKMKAYTHVFLGLLYSIWGILFLIFSIVFVNTTDERIFGFIVTTVFFSVAYKKIRKYTNVFDILLKR